MSRNPLSSRNVRRAPRRAAFFYPGPFLPLPLGDGCFVALEGTPFRLLPTPAEAVPQQRPDANGAVAHAEPLANDLTDPLQRMNTGSRGFPLILPADAGSRRRRRLRQALVQPPLDATGMRALDS